MLAKVPTPSIPFPVGGNWMWKARFGINGGVVDSRAPGYSRRPLETPAAYELIDASSGNEFIVLGGLEEDNQSADPPSANLLPTVNRKNDSRSRGTAAGFGRLKAQKVKALVGKTLRGKQDMIREEDDEDVVEDRVFCQTFPSSSILDSMRKKLITGTVTQPKESRKSKEVDSLDRYYEVDEEISASRNNADTKRDGFRIPHERHSAATSRGWGNRRAVFSSNESTIDKKRLNNFCGESDFFSRKTFGEIGCSDYMIESLKEQNFIRPSHIQALAFAPITEGKSCVIADQSGSGKTLAYLLPVIQRIREEELQGHSKSFPRCPRVVVLAPTAELASQVLGNCRAISKFGVPFRSLVMTGGFRQKTQLENLEQGVDVLIATPGRFIFLIKEGFLELTNLRCAVLDEVDILFNDEGFEVALQSLINSSPVTAQYLFVTATLPLGIYNKLVEIFPDCDVIMGPRMHRISPRLEEVLVDCSGDDKTEKTPETAFLNKKTALIQLIEGNLVPKTIIFCNKIETCRKVENILKRFDRKGSRIQVLPFHAALAQELRLANMKEFTNSQPEGDSLFLVCTDRASRGIDFSGVDHVVLFDFPRDPSEYVRRVGRTARGARGKGKAFIFVVGKQVPLARKIIERNQKGHPLHEVPSAYEVTSQ